ncbi:MAG: hypothetical protein ACRD6W_00715 [Nitrososphaerales archaeon]
MMETLDLYSPPSHPEQKMGLSDARESLVAAYRAHQDFKKIIEGITPQKLTRAASFRGHAIFAVMEELGKANALSEHVYSNVDRACDALADGPDRIPISIGDKLVLLRKLLNMDMISSHNLSRNGRLMKLYIEFRNLERTDKPAWDAAIAASPKGDAPELPPEPPPVPPMLG